MPDEFKKFHDAFGGGPTKDQVEHADRFLGGFELPGYVEKRDLAQDYRSAELRVAGQESEPIEAMVSLEPVEDNPYHVVLSKVMPDAADNAELSLRRPGGPETWKGRLEPQHRGLRESDHVTEIKAMTVSFFHRNE